MNLRLTKSTIYFLIIGCVFMLVMQLIRTRKYQLSIKNAFLLFFCIVGCGILGTYILFYIENGIWGGISFYGAILIGPVLLYPFVKLLKLNFRQCLSWCCPTICVVHILSKINCYIGGCCAGGEFYNSLGLIPLQLLEAIFIFLIMIFLFIGEKKNNKSVYSLYLIGYGFIRLFLNSFRLHLEIFILVPAGHFWSIVAIIIGAIDLYYQHKKMIGEN